MDEDFYYFNVDNCLTVMFILFGGFILSSLFTALYCDFEKHNDSDSDDNSDSDSDQDEDNVPYENKYEKIYKFLSNELKRTESDESVGANEIEGYEKPVPLTQAQLTDLINKKVVETTPKGDVIMFYKNVESDKDLSGFIYYCDDKTIPYKYLDTVARLYTIEYNCPEIYLFMKEEIKKELQKRSDEEKEREKAKEIQKELEKEKEGDEDEDKNKNNKNNENEQNIESEKVKTKTSVFATLKNYKTPKQTEANADDNTKSKSKSGRKYFLIGKNRYTRLGTIEDYKTSLTQNDKKNKQEFKQVSFSDFKKMMNENNSVISTLKEKLDILEENIVSGKIKLEDI